MSNPKFITMYQIRCQGLGILPGIFCRPELAEGFLPAAVAAERAAFGETGKDGDPRWARIVAVPVMVTDADLSGWASGFAAWEGDLPPNPASPKGPPQGGAKTQIGDVIISAVGTVGTGLWQSSSLTV